jgi:predicted ATP-grasp superfamily ATP-dependent carboligase
MQAFNKEMLGSARQYLEKALQSLANTTVKNDYVISRHSDITEQLDEITEALKNTNAKDAAKKAKSEEDELDLLFQPKKKW